MNVSGLSTQGGGVGAMGGLGDDESHLVTQFFSLAGNSKDILTAISKSLPTEDLRNFRSASRLFYTASLSQWRQTTGPRVTFAVPVLEDDHQNPEVLLSLPEAINLPIERYDLLKLGKYPMKKFTIFHWGDEAADLIDQFFLKSGSSVCRLDLRHCDTVGSPEMIRALKHATKLKTLVLKECHMPVYTDEREEDEQEVNTTKGLTVTHLVIETADDDQEMDEDESFAILKDLPLLKELTIFLHQPLANSLNDPHPGFMECLRSYKEQVGNGDLKVKIHGLVEFEGSLDELLEATIPLENWRTVVELPQFPDMLASKARKLRDLMVGNSVNPVTNVYNAAFPFEIELPALRTISLIGRVTNSFNFLNFMPAIRSVLLRLHFENRVTDGNQLETNNNDLGDDDDNEAEDNEDIMENTLDRYKFGLTMEHLVSLQIDRPFRPESLPLLKRMMPNLSLVSMIFENNAMFSFVCANWPDLTYLRATTGSKINDSGITGVDYYVNPLNPLGRRPNLTSLKSLEYFEVNSQYCLTDDSVHFAFLRMDKLKQLLVRSDMCESFESGNMLREKFGPYKLEQSDGHGGNGELS